MKNFKIQIGDGSRYVEILLTRLGLGINCDPSITKSIDKLYGFICLIDHSQFKPCNQMTYEDVDFPEIDILQLRANVLEKERKDLNDELSKRDTFHDWVRPQLKTQQEFIAEENKIKIENVFDKIREDVTNEMEEIMLGAWIGLNPHEHRFTGSEYHQENKPSETTDRIEVGKVYEVTNAVFMIHAKTKQQHTYEAYGFLDDKWSPMGNFTIFSGVECDPEKWEKLLAGEADRIGYKQGNYKTLTGGDTVPHLKGYHLNGLYRLYTNTKEGNSNIIMNHGVWAEVIPEKKILFTTEDGVEMYDSGSGYSDKKCYPVQAARNEDTIKDLDSWHGNCRGETVGIIYFHSKDAAIKYIKERDKPKYEVVLGSKFNPYDGESETITLTIGIATGGIDQDKIKNLIEKALNEDTEN